MPFRTLTPSLQTGAARPRFSRERALAPGALLVIVIAVHLVGISLYPGVDPDEGYWVSGARNFILYHDPVMDSRLHAFLSPANFLLLASYFSAVRASLFNARVLSSILGLLSCVQLYFAAVPYIKRSWLVLACAGLSSIAVSVQRMALLESHQMFWLVVTATLLLRRKYSGGSIAFGVSLLVKANSLFLLPAIVATILADGWRPVCRFCLVAVTIAAGGYAIDYYCGPQRFLAAFHHELSIGQVRGVVYHIGRFGLAPRLAAFAAAAFVRTDPILIPLALAEVLIIIKARRLNSLPNRLFVSWLAGGLLAHFGQTYMAPRYLSTLEPAIAWLAATCLNDFFERPRALRSCAIVLFTSFFLLHTVHLGIGIGKGVNDDYWATVDWVSTHLPDSARILVAPYLGVSLPLQAYDFYYLLFPFNSPPNHLEAIVRAYGITYIIEEAEWRGYSTADTREFIAQRCSLGMTIGRFRVWEVRAPHDRTAPARQGSRI